MAAFDLHSQLRSSQLMLAVIEFRQFQERLLYTIVCGTRVVCWFGLMWYFHHPLARNLKCRSFFPMVVAVVSCVLSTSLLGIGYVWLTSVRLVRLNVPITRNVSCTNTRLNACFYHLLYIFFSSFHWLQFVIAITICYLWFFCTPSCNRYIPIWYFPSCMIVPDWFCTGLSIFNTCTDYCLCIAERHLNIVSKVGRLATIWSESASFQLGVHGLYSNRAYFANSCASSETVAQSTVVK